MGIAIHNDAPISVSSTDFLFQVDGELLLGREVDGTVCAFRFDLQMREFVPFQVEFVLKRHVALSARQIRVFLHVQREMTFEQEFFLTMLAVKSGLLAVLTKICTAVDARVG